MLRRTGNQVRFLDDPVTVIGSFGADSHWDNGTPNESGQAVSEKACQSDELKSGNLPVLDLKMNFRRRFESFFDGTVMVQIL